MNALAKFLFLSFAGGALCGAGWALGKLAITALRQRYTEHRINRYRDRQVERLERIARAVPSECGKHFTCGELDDIRRCVCVRPAGHQGRCLGEDIGKAIARDFSHREDAHLVSGSSAEN